MEGGEGEGDIQNQNQKVEEIKLNYDTRLADLEKRYNAKEKKLLIAMAQLQQTRTAAVDVIDMKYVN